MRLNLGCGYTKYPGYINVDSAPECAPDVLWDLEKTPWPWEDDSVEEIKMEHILEHVGQTGDEYLNIWKELYRVCKNGALIDILVPYWRHDYFFDDPTHIRPITPRGIQMLSQKINAEQIQAGVRASKLGLLAGVDIELDEKTVVYGYDEEQEKGQEIVQLSMKPRVVKPPRGAALLARQSDQVKNSWL